MSSAQGVAMVQRLARKSGWGKVKAGHGGTLDPLATGVLPIALNEATKLCGRMLDAEKEYAFTVAFGVATDTDDAEGRVVAESAVRPTLAALEAALPSFTGPIRQRPPAYSALKVGGERAYALARAGEAVELAEREVVVWELKILPGTGSGTDPGSGGGEGAARHAPGGAVDHAPPPASLSLRQPAVPDAPPPRSGGELSSVTLLARVSKGTYIRSLARDLALALGTVGHVTMLRRTRAGPFALAQALTVDKLNALCDGGALGEAVLPLTAGLDGIPALAVTGDEAAALRQGRTLGARPGSHGLCVACLEGVPVALVLADGGGIRVERGFNLP
jgi:tRNA pseudouridine55 synthase